MKRYHPLGHSTNRASCGMKAADGPMSTTNLASHSTYGAWALSSILLLVASCWNELPANHCYHNGGDSACNGMSCDYCTDENRGCTNELPSNECHFPGGASSGTSTANPEGGPTTASLSQTAGSAGGGDTTTTASANPSTTNADSTSADTGVSASDSNSTSDNSNDSHSMDTGSSDGDPYPSCPNNMPALECPRGYDACYDFIDGYNMCSYTCQDNDNTDCPAPASGTAMPLCTILNDGTCAV